MRTKFRIASVALLALIVWIGGAYVILRAIIGDDADPFLNKIWVLDSIETDGQTITPENADDFRLIFIDDKWVIGDDGCNFFAGIFSRNRESISISDLIQTDNVCTGADEANIEALVETLTTATTHSLDDEMLHIQGQTDTLRFSSRGSRGSFNLERVTWQLLWIGLRFDVEPSCCPEVGDPYKYESTIRFMNGQMVLDTGCNGSTNRYRHSPNQNKIHIPLLFRTQLMCAPQAIMDQETRLYYFFSGSDLTFIIFDNLLVLTKENQMMVFVAVR